MAAPSTPAKKDWNCWKRGLAELKAFEQPKLRPQFQLDRGPTTSATNEIGSLRNRLEGCIAGHGMDSSLLPLTKEIDSIRSVYLHVPTRATPDLPAAARRAVAVRSGPHQRQPTGTSEDETEMTNTPRTLQQRIDQPPASARWALPNIDDGIGVTEDDGLGAANLIRSGDAIEISDGSFNEKRGTSALRTTSWRRGIYKMEGCEDDDQCAYRSEAAGRCICYSYSGLGVMHPLQRRGR